MKNYEITKQATPSGFNYIRITQGKFEDIVYSYSRVSIEEQEDSAVLHYDYTIHLGAISEKEKQNFEQTIGDILSDLIREQIATNSAVYAGGTDK